MKHHLFAIPLALFLLAFNHTALAGLGTQGGQIDFGQLLASANEPAQPQGELTIAQTETIHETQVVYTTAFTNNTPSNADVIDIVNPIPDEAIYLPNTATGHNCEISFSIDGGLSWDKPQNLTVRNSDGSLRPARPSDYTHIRWIYSAGLAPKASSQVSFAVIYP